MILSIKYAEKGSHTIKTLYITCAASGSGKSTYAKKLKDENPNLVVCSADNYFIKDGVYTFNPSGLGAAHQQCEFEAQVGMAKGLETIVDNTNTQWKSIEIYIRLAAIYGYSVKFIIFDVPKEKIPVLVARNAHGVPEKAVQRQWDGVQELKKTLKKHMTSRFHGVTFEITNLPFVETKANAV